MTNEEQVEVVIPQRDHVYPIVIGYDLFGRIAEDFVNGEHKDRKVSIVTDSNVLPHAKRLESTLNDVKVRTEVFHFPAGEKSKNRDTENWVYDQMVESEFGRDSVIVAIGGGVVGDLAGLVAAEYTRDLPLIQVPTSLLAAVDSSIGGKTAVDIRLPSGRIVKNHKGAFKHPDFVYTDLQTFETLHQREFVSGLAEVWKYGIIFDSELFDYLEKNIDTILSRDPDVVRRIIKRSCEIKAHVVNKDPREKGLRQILNFGHTIGHPIEAISLSRPREELLHGEAVAIGMVRAAYLAHKVNGFPLDQVLRIGRNLVNTGFVIDVPDYMSHDEIIELTKKDKKARGGDPKYTLPKRIGEMEPYGEKYSIKVSDDLVREVLN